MAHMFNASHVLTPSKPHLFPTPLTPRHTVCYDDGEVGMHRLWQHDERIRLASPVEHWPRDATLARHRLQLAQERLRSRDVGRRTAVSGGSGAGVLRAIKRGRCCCCRFAFPLLPALTSDLLSPEIPGAGVACTHTVAARAFAVCSVP